MINWFGLPGFRSSIFTYAPGLPVEFHLMVFVVPLVQISVPFGERTVMVGTGIVKLSSLMPEYAALVVLVIFTL